jgi:glycosidase
MPTDIVRFALAGTVLIAACHAAENVESAPGTAQPPEWSRSAVIYEVNVRQYTPQGTFAAFQNHLGRLDSLGVDILWFMPVQPIGKVKRKGVLGSYYSISDYTAINPEHGNEKDFRSVVDSAHKLGMRVILDWVANHSAFDHEWIRTHPGWYARRPDGAISNARDNEGRETDWTDVAELNYDNQDLRRAMIAEMKWWVQEMGIDGFRCDVAGGVPNEFWADVRRELTTLRPDIFLLAEAETPQMHQYFDMTYGWELHHLMNEVVQEKKPTSELDAYFTRQATAYPATAYRMYFTSNHDENSWQGTEFERMGANHAPAFVLAATIQQSMPLLYTGQEASLQKRLRFFEKDTVNWRGQSLAHFYRTMFQLKDENPALWNGAHGGTQKTLQTEGADRVFAFSRSRDTNHVVVAVNFADVPVTVRYSDLPSPGNYDDVFGDPAIRLEETGQLDIPPNGFRILSKGSLANQSSGVKPRN